MPPPPANSDPLHDHAQRIDELVEKLEKDLPNPDAVKHAGRTPPPGIPESLRAPVQEPTSQAVKWKHAPDEGKVTGDMARAFSMGTGLVASVVGMVVLGWALERWVFPKATPWLMLGGCFVGLVAGMWSFFREAKRGK